MDEQMQNPLGDVTCVEEIAAAKGWLSDGTISLDGVVVEHHILPPDEIQLPALEAHMLSLAMSSGTRQMTQFGGLAFDGATAENHFFLLPTGIPSEFAWESEDEALIFGISPQALRKTAERTGCIAPEKIELKPTVVAYDNQITRYAHLLLHEIRTAGIGGKLCSESILTCFNIHLLRHYCAFEAKVKDDTGGLAPYKLKEILEHIDSNLTDGNLSLATMAELTELSTYYFARQFKQSTGYAPHKYVIHLRLEKAKRLLKQRKLSIAQVAIECGFANQSHFGKAFKKAVGTTPKRYREEV